MGILLVLLFLLGVWLPRNGAKARLASGNQSRRRLSSGFAAGSGIGLSGTIAAGKDEIRIHRSYEVAARRTDAIRSQSSLLPLAQDAYAMKDLRVWLHLGASKIPERVIP